MAESERRGEFETSFFYIFRDNSDDKWRDKLKIKIFLGSSFYNIYRRQYPVTIELQSQKPSRLQLKNITS
jgi:hypothetical protein